MESFQVKGLRKIDFDFPVNWTLVFLVMLISRDYKATWSWQSVFASPFVE